MLIECKIRSYLNLVVLVSYQKLFIHELLALQNSFDRTPNCNTDSCDMPPRRAPSVSTTVPSRAPTPSAEESEVCPPNTMEFR